MMTPFIVDTSSITTSLTGLLKGASGSIAAAVAGTDYPGLSSVNTFSANNSFTASMIIAPNGGSGVPTAYSSIAAASNNSTTLMFPSSGTNVSTVLQMTPRGTGDGVKIAVIEIYGTDIIADGSNYSLMRFGAAAGGTYLISSQAAGTGTVFPFSIQTGANTNQLNLAISGAVAVGGTPTTGAKFHVKTGASSNNLDSMTYAGTISLDVTLGNVHKTITTSVVGNATINASAAGVAGQEITIIIANDVTAGRTITFGTNFRSTGTIVGTANKVATIRFVSDGTSWYETSRTLGV